MNKMVERYDDLVDIITEQYEDDIINACPLQSVNIRTQNANSRTP